MINKGGRMQLKNIKQRIFKRRIIIRRQNIKDERQKAENKDRRQIEDSRPAEQLSS